ncbi:MAG: hypothetical protein GC164_11575 [Phycisphaera sp.]|nr:hypothetical protein [Phycisphaera sp.]
MSRWGWTVLCLLLAPAIARGQISISYTQGSPVCLTPSPLIVQGSPSLWINDFSIGLSPYRRLLYNTYYSSDSPYYLDSSLNYPYPIYRPYLRINNPRGPNYVALYPPTSSSTRRSDNAHTLPGVPNVREMVNQPEGVESSPAWRALVRGHSESALVMFSRMLGVWPTDAQSRLGQGLCYAVSGQRVRAIEALRRAWATSDRAGDGLDLGTTDLEETLRRLADESHARTLQSVDSLDDYFVVAVMSYLTGQMDRALDAAILGEVWGDHTAELKNLRTAIERESPPAPAEK